MVRSENLRNFAREKYPYHKNSIFYLYNYLIISKNETAFYFIETPIRRNESAFHFRETGEEKIFSLKNRSKTLKMTIFARF